NLMGANLVKLFPFPGHALSKMKILNLSRNLFRSISWQPQTEYFNFTSIDFSYNSISKIQSINSVYLVESFNLSFNYLTQLSHLRIRNISLITNLDMSHNRISSIHLQAFQSAKQLKEIYLDTNYLRNLKFTSMMPNVKVL
ncbi:Platelet glycoprotein Ib alpha chain, partial [Trichoplax sp. H2]